MHGLILGAGRGSRMKGLTSNQPKCLTELGGKPLIEYQLDALAGAGIDETAIVGGYEHRQLVPYTRTMFVNDQWHKTNMVTSLYCADSWLTKQTTIVTYSDIVYTSETVHALAQSPGDIVITYDSQWKRLWEARFENPLDDAEHFSTDSKGCLNHIGGKPTSIEQIHGQYMGLLKFSPEGWEATRTFLHRAGSQVRDSLDMTTLLQRLVDTGVFIYTVPVQGRWYEVDSQKDLQLYEQEIRSGQSWLPPHKKAA